MHAILKRILDILGALLLIGLTTPLTLAVAIAVWLTIGRPVLFRQLRPGLNERLVTCLRFRTMSDACSQDGRLLSDEERVTRLTGSFLRRTNLDRLPQLWNILRGDLSFVGPQLLFVRYLSHYTQEQRCRHSVRPGLTGWAQVHAERDLSLKKMLEMDVWYVEHMSLWLDVLILLQTVWMPPRRRNGGRKAPRTEVGTAVNVRTGPLTPPLVGEKVIGGQFGADILPSTWDADRDIHSNAL